MNTQTVDWPSARRSATSMLGAMQPDETPKHERLASIAQAHATWVANQEADKARLAMAIDTARDEGVTWAEIAEAVGGEGRQAGYELRRRLPDPD